MTSESTMLGISYSIAEAMSFQEWQVQWSKKHDPQMKMNEDPEHSTSKRTINKVPSATFVCDHCKEKGTGVPFELPDPTGEVGPQGSFCSKECMKSVSEYELGRQDISDLIDKMAGCAIEPAPPWTQLHTVLKTEGLVREDWTNKMVLDEEDEPDVPEVNQGTGITKKNKNGISI
jgi:hypothetical protein